MVDEIINNLSNKSLTFDTDLKNSTKLIEFENDNKEEFNDKVSSKNFDSKKSSSNLSKNILKDNFKILNFDINKNLVFIIIIILLIIIIFIFIFDIDKEIYNLIFIKTKIIDSMNLIKLLLIYDENCNFCKSALTILKKLIKEYPNQIILNLLNVKELKIEYLLSGKSTEDYINDLNLNLKESSENKLENKLENITFAVPKLFLITNNNYQLIDNYKFFISFG